MSDFENNKPVNETPAAGQEQPVSAPAAEPAQATRVMKPLDNASGSGPAEEAGQPVRLPRRRRSENAAGRAPAQTPAAERPPLPTREEVAQMTMNRRRMEQPAQGVPRPEALRRANAAPQQPAGEHKPMPRALKSPVKAPGYSQSQPLGELERPRRGAPSMTEAPARTHDEPDKASKPRLGLVVLVIVVLLAASLLLGLLLIPDNAPGILGTVKSSVVSMLGGSAGTTQPASTAAPEVLDFSAAPTSVQVGQTITFTLTTTKSAENVRLVNEEGAPLSVQNKMWDNADGIIWSMSLTMYEPYDGLVRLQIASGEQWMDTNTTMGIKVISNAAETPAAETAETAAPDAQTPEQPTDTQEPAPTAEPGAAVTVTEEPVPVTEAPVAEATQEPVAPVTEAPADEVTAEPVTEAPTAEPVATPTMAISPTPTIPVEAAVTAAPVMVGVTPEPAADDGNEEGGDETEPQVPEVLGFTAARTVTVAPGVLSFTLTTTADARDLRLMSDDGEAMPIITTMLMNGEENMWLVDLPVEVPYDGLVFIQVSDGAEWYDTEMSAYIQVMAPDAANDEGGETEPETEPVPEATAEPDADDEVIIEDEETQPEQTVEPAVTAEPLTNMDQAAAFTVQAAGSADPSLITEHVIYDGNSKQTSYLRDEENRIDMAQGSEYMLFPYGVMTFRGDNFRQNAAFDTVGEIEPTKLTVAWRTAAGSVKGNKRAYYGIGWTGQPAIIKWSSQVREASNINAEKKATTALREVIVAGEDGKVYFLDLKDGQETRKAINVGYPLRGTPSIHPYGLPLMAVGQYARQMASGNGDIGMRVYNLLDQKQLFMLDGLDKDYKRPYYSDGAFDTSSLYDADANTLISVGTNGMLYLTQLDATFSVKADGSGEMSVGGVDGQQKAASIVLKSRVKGQENKQTAVKSSMAMYGSYVYYADMAGILRCVDVNTLEIMWAVDTGDAVQAAISLEMDEDGTLWLYTANTLQNRKKGDCQIRRYNAATGEADWTLGVNVTRQKDNIAGAMASPVIGQNGLSDYAYFTLSYVSKKGASAIGLNTKKDVSALVCVEKATGNVVWSYQLSSFSYSSPVAVYNSEGKGWIVQAANDGTLVLLDGATGEKVNSLKLNGKINASPAVYKNTLVIGTQGGKKEAAIYAITIE